MLKFLNNSCHQHNLRMIILQENLLTGTIPAELAQLKNVKNSCPYNKTLVEFFSSFLIFSFITTSSMAQSLESFCSKVSPSLSASLLLHFHLFRQEVQPTVLLRERQWSTSQTCAWTWPWGKHQAPRSASLTVEGQQVQSDSGLREVDDDEKNVCKGDKVK